MPKDAKPDPLLALASTSPESLKVRICHVVRTIESLDEARRDALRFLVDESGHSGSRVAQACKEAGVSLSAETINTHRRKACACPAA